MAWLRFQLRRAPGVTLFFCIWLLVALVPLWRLNAARQWRGDQSNDQLGFSAASERIAARRFPDDPATAALEFRDPPGSYNAFAYTVARQHRISAAEFARLDAILARFPGDLPLRAQWLRQTTRGNLQVESDALLATYQLGSQRQDAQRRAWLSRATLERAIQVAREGARLDSGNAFWPWVEAVYQFSLRRDDLALRALQKAGDCARFDDGVDAAVRRRIALMHRVQTADFNDDLLETSSALLPHFAPMRAAARQAMWDAKLALQGGDVARALQIADAVQRAGAPLARSDSSLITRLVGEAICGIAWQQTLVNAGQKPTEPSGNAPAQLQAYRRQTIERFGAYARANGRPDLARSATRLQASLRGHTLSELFVQKPNRFPLLQSAQVVARFHQLNAWLLYLAAASAAVWLPSALLFGGPLAPRRAVLFGAAFRVGVTGALLGINAMGTPARGTFTRAIMAGLTSWRCCCWERAPRRGCAQTVGAA